MPRPGPRKPSVTFRPAPDLTEWLDTELDRLNAAAPTAPFTRTDVINAALTAWAAAPAATRTRKTVKP